MTTKPRTLHEKIEQFARDLIWGRADHECGGLHAGVCRQCDEDVQHLTRKLETLFAALLEAVPRLQDEEKKEDHGGTSLTAVAAVSVSASPREVRRSADGRCPVDGGHCIEQSACDDACWLTDGNLPHDAMCECGHDKASHWNGTGKLVAGGPIGSCGSYGKWSDDPCHCNQFKPKVGSVTDSLKQQSVERTGAQRQDPTDTLEAVPRLDDHEKKEDGAALIGPTIPTVQETEPRLNYDNPDVLRSGLLHLRCRIDENLDVPHYREYHLEVIDAALQWIGGFTVRSNIGQRGSKNSQSKLTEDKVRTIRERLCVGETGASLSREYGVSENVIYQIKHNKVWRHVKAGSGSVPISEASGLNEQERSAQEQPTREGTEPRLSSEDDTVCTDGYCSTCGAIALTGADYCEDHEPSAPHPDAPREVREARAWLLHTIVECANCVPANHERKVEYLNQADAALIAYEKLVVCAQMPASEHSAEQVSAAQKDSSSNCRPATPEGSRDES